MWKAGKNCIMYLPKIIQNRIKHHETYETHSINMIQNDFCGGYIWNSCWNSKAYRNHSMGSMIFK